MKTQTSFLKKIAIGGIVFLLVAVFGFYGYKRAQALIKGPSIELRDPGLLEQQFLSDAKVTIAGSAKNTQEIFINGEQVFMSPEGAFSEIIIAPEGYSTAELSAHDKFGNTITQTLYFYLEQQPSTEPPNETETDTKDTIILNNS